MLCPQCGRDSPTDARFCVSCGSKLESARAARPRRRWFTRKRTLFPLGGVLVLVALFALCIPGFLSAKGEAEGVVKAFLEAAAAGDGQLAVEYHSPRTDYRDELAEIIRTGQWSVFEGYEDISINGFDITLSNSPGDSSVDLSGSIVHTDGSRTPLEVSRVKESGSWKIVAFFLGTEQ